MCHLHHLHTKKGFHLMKKRLTSSFCLGEGRVSKGRWYYFTVHLRVIYIGRLVARLLPAASVTVEDKTGYEEQEISKFLPLKNTAIKRQIASSSMFTLWKCTVSLMRCRKPDRQLGNHSLFTAVLEGRDDMGGGCWESGGVGVELGAPAWANSSWEGVVLIPVTDMLLSLEQTW